MILKFNDYIKLNEEIATATLADVLRVLRPDGWEYYHKKNGDGITFSKGDFKVGGNLKHNASRDENRYVDINTLDAIRGQLIADYKRTKDPSTLKKINWNAWRLKDPFTKELKGVDPNTGKKKEDLAFLNSLEIVDQIYKNVFVIKNMDGEYNLCSSESDKTPLLDTWYPLYQPSKTLMGKMCLGYDSEDEDNFGTHLFEIKEDGTLGETINVDYVVESLKKS